MGIIWEVWLLLSSAYERGLSICNQSWQHDDWFSVYFMLLAIFAAMAMKIKAIWL